MNTAKTPNRKPHVVAADDPSVEFEEFEKDDTGQQKFTVEPGPDGMGPHDAGQPQTHTPDRIRPGHALRGGIKWGAVLLSAMAGLAALAASLSFASFVSHVLAREDWIGWLGLGLAVIIGVAFAVIACRELFGLIRLSQLTRLRTAITKALRDDDVSQERAVVKRLRTLYDGRADLKWQMARLKDHQSDVRDAGELLRLADREVMAPLDVKARGLILKSAKRVTVATAISPMVWMAMLYVVAENLRLIKSLATLYGARPGGVGAVKLGRMVFTHILATGGLALTDDLLGQFLGQDLVRRLSRRLGEGVFNGALTARVGTAAVAVTRPLPFLDAEPLRLRDIMRELVRTAVKTKT